MIYVDRKAVKAPTVLSSAKAKAAFADAKKFYERPLASRVQEHAPFSAEIWKQTKPALKELFNSKCAYCETIITDFSSVDVVDMFRPKGGAIDFSKKFDPDHYWWLVYEWFNLYSSCAPCNQSKSSRFPVQGKRVKVPKGKRVELGASWYVEDLKSEKPLLLDPCEEGFDPDEHLVFDGETGSVAALTQRGKVTIEIFTLNRTDLVAARRKVLTNLVDSLTLFDESLEVRRQLAAQVNLVLQPATEYVAAKRQFIRRLVLEGRFVWLKDVEGLSEILHLQPKSKSIKTKEVRKLIKKSHTEQKLREKRKTRRAGLNSQYITRIEIHNFRVIEHLQLDFPNSLSEQKSWLVLLGENGVGKSSILKAVALALQDKDYFSKAKLNPAKFLRTGSKSGYVKVHLTDYSQPFELHFDDKHFTKPNPNQLQTYLFGYGGTRLLPQSTHKPATSKGVVRAENLFDPFLPLINAKSWMLSLGRKPFGYSALALKDLLVRENRDRIFRRNGEIKLQLADFGTSSPLEDLSDGYQSIVALTADILKVMLETWPTADKAQGIVLLDEIDVHLHPRWKIEIINRLRRTFPRVQFIVTTHDPLCLMGTQPGEVHVLHRDLETERILATQFDVPPGTTADRVLTGFWFGLPSTTDRDTFNRLEDYYRLSRERPTQKNQTRLHHLQEELRSRFGSFADTSIDRIAQSVAAEVIGENSRSWNANQRAAVRSEIKAKVVRKLSRRG